MLPAVAALAETLGTRPGHSFPSFRESGVIRVVPGISLRCPPSHDEWLDNLDAIPAHLIYLRERADAAMVPNANEAATPPPATQIALADLFGCSHSNRGCRHDH
jgi:hypothetical protein